MTSNYKTIKQISSNSIAKYWPIFLSFGLLTLLTIYKLVMTTWQENDQAHGPLVLIVVLYLFYEARSNFKSQAEPCNFIGYVTYAIGVVLYVLGKSQDIVIFELGSLILILSSIILIFKGYKVLKSVWFPLFFLFFLVPLPGFIVDSITMPMKIAVSTVAEHILYWFDYPVARSGVIIQIGQYQLLVADACAGMHTLISLEALGLLYLNLVKHDSFARNLTLALFIIPISFTANTVRVIAITLVTFYFGDEVGQGFVHGLAGMLLFLIALVLIIMIDTAIQSFIKKDNS